MNIEDNRGSELEGLLTTTFLSLREAEELTENKIDLEFMLSIVGSYITAKEQDKLVEGHLTPTEIFTTRVFPLVDDSVLEVEEVDAEGE